VPPTHRDRAIEDERQRIMLDMHDGLGSQLLSSLARVERGAMAQRDMAEALRHCIAEMRLALDALAPSDEDDFRAAFGNFRYRWDAQLGDAGVQATWALDTPEHGWQVPAHRRLDLLRVLQEALTNVVKHARARRVQVDVACPSGGLRVEIRDDGRGFDPASGRTGHGLRSMHARAQRLGAALTIAPASPGTHVVLQFGPASTAATPSPAPAASPTARPSPRDSTCQRPPTSAVY
jgi:signal transduction histidine kinase